MFSQIFSGLAQSFVPTNLLMILIGVLVGILVGAMPGLTASIAVIILLPFTYGLDAVQALILLGAAYCGSMYGGSISSILINTPGTPAAALTAKDGYPLAQQGRAGEALGMAAFSSWFGGTISVIVLLIFSRTIAKLALSFGPPEFFLLALLGLTIIVSLSKSDPISGVISAAIGLLLGTVGMDMFNGQNRFTFGSLSLVSGMPLVPVLIALLSVPHIFKMAKHSESFQGTITEVGSGRVLPSLKNAIRLLPNLIRSSLIGVFIGALPGAGGSIASFMAYDVEKKMSKTPEKFGSGCLDGVASCESSNNGVTGGAIATMLTLGIPGSPVTAVMLGGLMMKGISPGPTFFETASSDAYAFIMSLFPSNLLMFVIGILGARYFVKVAKCPNQVLLSLILVLATVGSYTVNNRIFDVYLMLFLGLLAFGMSIVGMDSMPAVLGFILGPIAEKGIRQTMIISNGSMSIFFHRTPCIVLIVLIAISILYPVISDVIKKKRKAAAQ